ncbi:hypothetical protein O1L60_34710 [Streptomyces diastatochromogenes]|nr:hypothetical protein [Streptomyces diastatochromogenes]
MTTAVALLALTAAAPWSASAQPSPGSPSAAPGDRFDGATLPDGWRITGDGTGRQLVWTSPERIPVGDARIEFRAGDRLLGHPLPRPDGRSYALPSTASGSARARSCGSRPAAGGSTRRAAPASPANAPRPAAVNPAPLPANPVDPGVPGRYRTVSGEYALHSVRLPGLPQPVEMRATVVGPADALGKRPVALFLHGRHATCYTPGRRTSGSSGRARRAPGRSPASRDTCAPSGSWPPRGT